MGSKYGFLDFSTWLRQNWSKRATMYKVGVILKKNQKAQYLFDNCASDVYTMLM